MSSTIIYERFLWLHSQIKQHRHPNAKTLAAQFEIAGKTAQRNIEFMRERLHAPLRYVPPLRGYAYEDDTWEIPGLWLHEDELISLVLSYRLAAAVPDNSVKKSLHDILNHVVSTHSSAGFSIDDIGDRISVKNIAYARTNENIFHQVLDALLKTKSLRIEYYSPHNHQATQRDVLPLHLLNYMGTWHIIAFCNIKKEIRDFVLSRIKSAKWSTVPIDARIPALRVKDYIRRTFGILHGEKTQDVCLRFARDIAPWITEQSWHPDQRKAIDKGGRLNLTIPVADFREIKREILRYGSQVEVVSPAALRKEVKNEIEKMRKVYI